MDSFLYICISSWIYCIMQDNFSLWYLIKQTKINALISKDCDVLFRAHACSEDPKATIGVILEMPRLITSRQSDAELRRQTLMSTSH